MGKRRQSREMAIQFLYQMDILGDEAWKTHLHDFWKENEANSDVREFAERVINMVHKQRKEIDKLIAQYTTNWEISRIAIVDRNVLRAAISELLFMEDIPQIVAINEAVDIAKKFGTPESGKFVNGILDKIRIEVIKENKK